MFYLPMLLETAKRPFTDDRYIFEPKIDGHRGILSRTGEETRLYTRHNNDVTRQYPELEIADYEDIVLDGEVACVDPDTGSICFETVMERFNARRSEKVQRLSIHRPANFVAFDVLRLRGQDLRGMPLMERKEILSDLSFSNPHIGKIPYLEGAGEALFTDICAKRMEGIVAKRKTSTYQGRRSADWLKVINWQYEEVLITGYRKAEFGWLAAVPDGGRMRGVGIIELGTTPTQRKAFYGISKQLKISEDREFVYLEPLIRAKVKIRNWTRAGMLRSPAFVEFCV